jgi:hypothetical protein
VQIFNGTSAVIMIVGPKKFVATLDAAPNASVRGEYSGYSRQVYDHGTCAVEYLAHARAGACSHKAVMDSDAYSNGSYLVSLPGFGCLCVRPIIVPSFYATASLLESPSIVSLTTVDNAAANASVRGE